MNQGQSEVSENVTVLVFKDNYAARTFQVPLRWISQFGVFLGSLFVIALVSSVIAFKYFRIASKVNTNHVRALEQEILELKAATHLNHPEQKAAEPLPGSQAPHVVIPNNPNHPSFSPPLSPTFSPSSSKDTLALNLFPQSFNYPRPDPASLPISIQNPKAYWQGHTLHVRFALQYTKTDGGSQQGKIVVLARGPESYFGYPAGIFGGESDSSFINPHKGEAFSVSRYREVKADFGPVDSQKSLKEIEVLILDKEMKVLLYQKLTPQKLGHRAGSPPEAPSPSESEPQSEPEPETGTGT